MSRWKTASDNQINRCVDSILNYETVKYYAGEEFEMKQYHKDTLEYHKEEFNMQVAYQLLKAVQAILLQLGLLTGSLYCAYLIVNGSLTTGQYIWFTLYIYQIYWPLNSLGFFYK